MLNIFADALLLATRLGQMPRDGQRTTEMLRRKGR